MAQINKNDNQVLKAFDVFKDTFLCKGKSIFDEKVTEITKEEINECVGIFDKAADKETKYDAVKNKFLKESASDKLKHILAHAEWLWALPWNDVGKDTTKEQIENTLGQAPKDNITKGKIVTNLFPPGIIKGGQLKTNKTEQIKSYLEFFAKVFESDDRCKNGKNLMDILNSNNTETKENE